MKKILLLLSFFVLSSSVFAHDQPSDFERGFSEGLRSCNSQTAFYSCKASVRSFGPSYPDGPVLEIFGKGKTKELALKDLLAKCPSDDHDDCTNDVLNGTAVCIKL